MTSPIRVIAGGAARFRPERSCRPRRPRGRSFPFPERRPILAAMMANVVRLRARSRKSGHRLEERLEHNGKLALRVFLDDALDAALAEFLVQRVGRFEEPVGKRDHEILSVKVDLPLLVGRIGEHAEGEAGGCEGLSRFRRPGRESRRDARRSRRRESSGPGETQARKPVTNSFGCPAAARF